MQEIKKVLTPIDFSDNAEKIASAAAYIAGTFKAELHLIFVAQNFEDYSGFFVPPVNLPNLEAELFESAKQRMVTFTEENKSTFENYEVQGVTSEVLSGDVAEEILDYAKKNDIHLIVMGTHGYKGLERIMFGSVADKVVKTACCPVMTINPYRTECEEKQK
ncbi:universal stress protein [Desulfogranum japonicum]|uniref:universal stress protein n=1 Tax=Desulfogranum japonicum TaxID=231447 RepID=UPI000406CE7D|nr:universal stress protein [Desulfogranum japonicum]